MYLALRTGKRVTSGRSIAISTSPLSLLSPHLGCSRSVRTVCFLRILMTYVRGSRDRSGKHLPIWGAGCRVRAQACEPAWSAYHVSAVRCCRIQAVGHRYRYFLRGHCFCSLMLQCIDEHNRLHVFDLAGEGRPKLQRITGLGHPVKYIQHCFRCGITFDEH